MEKLAIHGGTPISSGDFNSRLQGARLLDDRERQAVLEVLESQALFRYAPGARKVAEFERDFAARLGIDYALAVCSGTAALHIAFASLGLTCGDEVLVPAFYYVATAHAILATGAIPVFVEVDESLGMDLEDLRRKISPRTKAIVPVHMRGVPSNITAISAIAKEHGLLLIEDCAQSCGATFQGQHVGTFGDAAAFSLQHEKVLTTGDGGVVVTKDPDVYERAVRFHNNGNFPGASREQAVIALNLRMPELSGAVAGEQLKKLDGILAQTRARHRKLKAGLATLSPQYPIEFQRVHDPEGDLGISLVMFVPEAKGEEFSRALSAEGIPNWWLYSSLGHSYHTSYQLLQKRTLNSKGFPFSCYPEVEYYPGMCPQTDSLLRRSIHFDINPFLTDEDLDKIIAGVEKVAYWLLRD